MSISASYPPAFQRAINNGDQTEIEPALDQDKDIHIPVIDLERLDKQILTEACKDWGIFRLENHGVPLELTSQLQQISESLLSLPFEEKRELFASVNSPLSYFWGTPALNRSGDALKRGGTQASNVKMLEGFNVPLSKLPVSTCDDGVQHSKLEPFRVLLEEYGRHITRIAVSLFEAIAQTLNLELTGDRRSELLSESTGLIRVYRYPQSSSVEAEGEALGMEVHTDSSVISILKEDETGGLEIMKGEEWLRVKPVADTLIINLGDMMQAISDDEYKSVKHRVKKKDRTRERHSVCYFVFPQRDCVIKSSNYKPFTYSEFEAQVQADIQSLGTKVGLHRFSPKSPLFL
ncbi:2-oxoglutarate (2OG) and Fe(II)-dependent oxygenase superfamily protein [Raphanus sativus]|uniref:Gibberellin 2-beta-dioxygenase 6 n=1 Tax=Raphanus sativus TaxID=3726 RepID=A0A6J0L9B4_RAPSA|nr:gibberellin 2-beta-dioxygenase 6 [Raphanus sativus]KAJ4875201.1 2-oxoglutarate (2OG) and Fe(II)-dependent oxygenase superfamily protein [Raphanus sativus]